MKNMTLGNIANACNGQFIGTEKEKELCIKGAVIDSRKIEEGYLFIPIKGLNVDGHNYISAVFLNGAIGTLSEKKLENFEKPYILVESSEQALKDIAMYYRNQLKIPIVGITGSVGKTSTKEMISSVLEQKYCVLKTEGNFNNEIGLPLTILKIREKHQVGVIEMGISDFGEMHRLSKIAKPDICVITNIGECHLENLIDRDGVLKAKSEIFDFMQTNGKIVINGDDDKLATIKEINEVEPFYYGVLDQNNNFQKTIKVKKIENIGLKGTKAVVQTEKGELNLPIKIPGKHNVYNAMAAVGVGLSLNLSVEQIEKGVSEAQTIHGRLNIIEINNITLIDDCYNANPVSMKASLDILETALGRKIAVLGDMGELGENEKALHNELGKYVAGKKIDYIFCVGTLSKEIEVGVKSINTDCLVHYFKTIEEMLVCLFKIIEKNDTILVKASHFMEFSKVIKSLKEYCEKQK